MNCYFKCDNIIRDHRVSYFGKMWQKKMVYTFVIFLLLHGLAQSSFAQADDGKDKDSTVNEYIENYKELLTHLPSLKLQSLQNTFLPGQIYNRLYSYSFKNKVNVMSCKLMTAALLLFKDSTNRQMWCLAFWSYYGVAWLIKRKLLTGTPISTTISRILSVAMRYSGHIIVPIL